MPRREKEREIQLKRKICVLIMQMGGKTKKRLEVLDASVTRRLIIITLLKKRFLKCVSFLTSNVD